MFMPYRNEQAYVYDREKWKTEQKIPFEPTTDTNSWLWAEHKGQPVTELPALLH
jgi:hypothetical protein